MSRLLIERYHNEIEKYISYGGSRNESSIRAAFQYLLQEYCKKRDFILIPELAFKTPFGTIVCPDGTVKDALRLDWGYWESKDEYDNLDDEIIKKFDIGYPKDNILFEDTQTAVLFQAGREAARVQMKDADALDRIISAFIKFERPEVKNFREAIEKFKQDVPQLSDSLRELIESQSGNKEYIFARDFFLELCKETINPDIVIEDIREMIVQHILTEDIFNTVFEETQFHRENNIARELEEVIKTFFTRDTKHQFLDRIHHYYAQIKAAASGIANHSEKQKFLKIIYENFYKAYSPKKADRLGVVYTPNEIVKFMIKSADYLCNKHFGKLLSDNNVEILDPAVGTGTYITELIEYMPLERMKYKYENEIHANEVAILSYYIANLNIEYTYKQKMGEYKEFENICFVDTLDNMGFSFKGQQIGAYAGFAHENKERIQRQNERKISVIIGNPPYNANQMNENENNKNRPYPEIDKRIKETYVRLSKAQKTKQYDMYKRFIRWASDRIGDYGIIAFITNRSFIDKYQDDGFRKIVGNEFSDLYIIDLGGDIRYKQKGSVFDIKTGVAISFYIKNDNISLPCKIFYKSLIDIDTKTKKFDYLNENKFKSIDFNHVVPDKENNWINQINNDFDSLVNLIEDVKSLFNKYAIGVNTARDEWVFGFQKRTLSKKMNYFIKKYKNLLNLSYKEAFYDLSIKWSEQLKRNFIQKKFSDFDNHKIINVFYRPFIKTFFYSDKLYSDRLTNSQFSCFGRNLEKKNILICVTNSERLFFSVIAVYLLPTFQFFMDPAQCLPLYRYDSDGNRNDNITDWGLEQFREHYRDSIFSKDGIYREVTKEDIFHYTYGVLHNPAYRKKYELNLKREFPRIPFYDDFWQWSEWGKKLMDLHINFETVEQYQLQRIGDPKFNPEQNPDARIPKAKLKADKESNSIILDEETTLFGIPGVVWDYKLGNRSAIEWILDQYKEKKPRDPTIREKFNTYKFADYKEKVIDLIKRVTTVSVETMKIIKEMENVLIPPTS